ncbi:MAG: SRPBCC family protein [Candidatus Krumholzibacteriia bacterium]
MRQTILLLLVLPSLTAFQPAAHAEVLDAAANGFTTRTIVTIAATPEAAWEALTAGFGQWWDPAHSFFGDAGKFTLDPSVGGAWIEDQGDGRWVRHLEVWNAVPGRKLLMRGGLGPLQEMGVAGALSFTFEPVEGGVEVALTYAVGGYHPQGLDVLAPIVDRVLGEQLERFKQYCEK